MTTIYLFKVVGENSEIYGEEFLTELENASKEEHIAYAREWFPSEEIRCYGRVSEFEAEMMGIDTY
jgi:hypothetical protein